MVLVDFLDLVEHKLDLHQFNIRHLGVPMDVSVTNEDFSALLMVLVVMMVIFAARSRVILVRRSVKLQNEEQSNVILRYGAINHRSCVLWRQIGEEFQRQSLKFHQNFVKQFEF